MMSLLPPIEELYLIEFLHQTTTTGCVRIDFMAFMPGFPTEKTGLNSAEVDLMSFFVFQRTNIAKYFRKTPTAGAYRVWRVRFSPEIQNIAVLFVRYGQDARISRWRHRTPYPIDVNLHVLLRGAMPDINRKLHHRKTVFLQRLAELSRMAPLGLGIGRQIEENEQPHDPIGIQPQFRHRIIPIRGMQFSSVFPRNIWPARQT